MHVFPAGVEALGWQNPETITFQNLDEYALLQEFNGINSASMNLSNATQYQLQKAVLPSDVPQSEMEDALDGEPGTTESLAPDTEDDAFVTTTEKTATSAERTALPVSPVFALPTTTQEVIDPETVPVHSQTTTTDTIDDAFEPPAVEDAATTTVLRRVESLFALALSAVTSVFDGEASTTDEVSVLTEAELSAAIASSSDDEVVASEEEVVSATVTRESVETADATTTVDTPTATETASPVPTSTSISEPVTADELSIDEQVVDVVPEAVSTSSEIVPADCSEDCKAYAITLSDFSFPLESDAEITGAQLRLSFAAKQKSTREHIPLFEMRYTLDGGVSWQTGGSIVIDGEVSNSINGGYYLFALPELNSQAALDQLQVEFSYQDDPEVVSELYVESTWLELFTLEPPETVQPNNFLELLQDDGYNEVPLSGDTLSLPDGKEIDFSFTDSNAGETLIIKSNERTFHGLSEATTYFSVTNISDDEDEFTVQTYFPDGVGAVRGLEVFNQNRPQDVVVPEYRPYVYHCADGWEYEGEFTANTIEDLSRQLTTPAADAAPATATSTTPAPVEFLVPSSTSSTTPAALDAVLGTSSNTTTVMNLLPSVSQLLQASVVASTSERSDNAGDAAVADDGEDAVPAYACRNTNIIRECDELDGGNTACRVNQVKVAEHQVVRYTSGWEATEVTEGGMPKPSFLKRAAAFIGLGPDRKDVPDRFEVRAHTPGTYAIQPGETLYFKLDIEFPLFSTGEYWIEAIGNSEYGLLDPFWSSQWQYRMPIKVSNPTGTDQTEYQVFFELDSALTDFWTNVNSDGSDIRFIQELPYSNFSNEGTAVNNWLDFDFGHRIPIEIPAGTVTEDLTNFPVSIDLSTLDSTFWANVKVDGGDVRVFTTDGTELPIDLAEIDTVMQTGALHFLADTIPANGASTFYLYFNDASLSGYASTSPMGARAVWTGANYNAVYHFHDDPTTIGNVVTDATGNGNDVTVVGAALATTSGQIGTAIDFSAGAGYLATTTWTFPGGDPLIVTGSYFMTAQNGESIFQWGTGAQPSQIQYQPWYNATNGRFTFGNTSGDEYTTLSQATTTWHGFGVMGTTSTSDSNYVYEDGRLVETLAQTVLNASNTNANGFQIGRQGGGGSWDGYLDELRVATTTRTQAWVRAESVNLYQPTQFYTPRQTQSPNNAASLNWYSTSWEQRIRLSIPAATLQEDLTDFPVYVDLATLGSSFFSGVASDGRDIRVTAGDGVTELPIEVVNINTGAGTGELYFKTDLSDADANDFYIYFNNSDVGAYDDDDTYGAHNVWTNGFQAVYHLEEDASGTGNANVYKDSTANEYDGDDENASDGKTGLFGAGQEFGDTQVDYLSLPYQVLDGLTNITTSWWHNTSAYGDQSIISGANSTQFNEFWDRLYNNGNNVAIYSQGQQENSSIDGGETYNDGTWQNFMITRDYDNQQKSFYRNGSKDTQSPMTANPVISQHAIDAGGLIIGQDQDALGGSFSTTENFEGILDELRFASVVRTTGWAAAEYENMANQGTFIATSSSETLQATNFVELDHWVQYFDGTGDEADIWVQVADLPAGEETIIYIYYGNSGAASASDELATFTYSTSTDLYYVVDNSGVVQVTVESLIDGNEVSLDGAAAISLDRGESTTFGTVSNTSVISTLGPISGTVTGSGNDSSDSIAPISFATTTFAIPLNRSTNRTYLLAPFASTTVRTYVGNSGTPNQTFNITTGAGTTATADPADSGTGTDGNGIVVEASSPILVTHRSTNPGDGIVSYPPTRRDIFGIDSQYFHLSATADNPDPTVYCSTGSGGNPTGTTRGEKDDITQCTTGRHGAGSAVRFTGAATPITAVQFADADGNEATAFWPQHEFGTRYAMTNDSAYAAIVCSPRFGAVDLEVLDPSGNTVASDTCTPSGNNPGKAYFGTDGSTLAYTGGHQVVATNGVPFYVTYEDITVEQDEKNIMGSVQGRKLGGEFAGYVFGDQELANDANWEQLSFGWYQNTDAVTPVAAWQSGSESLSEGDVITGAGAVDNGDVLRLRINLEASNATATVNTNAFILQYAAAASGQCSAVTTWYDLGEQGSTTAAFSGYNNSNTADGTTLATSTLADTTVLGTYEERNYSDFLPYEVPVGDVVEYDWVIEGTNITVNTNYCFRLTRAQGSELETYTLYPELETVGPPNTPILYVFFDNERTGVLTPVLEFAATDNAGDDIDYQVQIDDDYDFGSVVLDRNSATHFTQFENINTPSDKSPFTSGARIRFTGASGLSPTTTYYWRVRANDPTGSATTSEWSTPFSYTTDTTLTVTEWFQTTGDQFNSNTLTNLSTSSGAVSVSTNPGEMISAGIDFDDATVGNAWGEVDWNDTETSGTITYQVEYNNNGSWTLVPDSLIPDNSIGTSTGPISLLDLDTGVYNEIRLVATFTGTTLSVQDWVVRWGLRVDTPTQGDPFDNQKVPTTTPVFDFISSDPQGDDIEYEISFSSSYDFSTGSTTYNSSTSAQFANSTDGGDSSPFDTDEEITFTTPGGSPFTNGQTYWWRTRARDPFGGNAWSPWSEPDAFTIDTGITLSTWYQTTEDQFSQGVLTGTIASTSDSVEVSNDVGEYGTATLTDNNWLTINTQRDYTDMVVVASAEYNGAAHGNARTPRVRNKTTNSFEIKVDKYTDSFVGTTVVDYIVLEAGDWTISDGGSGIRVIAGTAADVADVQIDTYTNTPGVTISFGTPFSTAPTAIATVSSNNDSNWIATHIDGGGTDDTEVTTSQMRVALALSRHTTSAHSGPEDIDYLVMARVTNGTNNGVKFESFNTNDQVDDVPTNGGYSQTFPTAFASAPGVTVVHNNAEDGGNGGFALKDTSGTQNGTSIFLSILEDGASADQHTQEIVSVIAFQNSSGLINRH
ncbi:DUF2341 domain-containing protein, partial [Candidatus Kaiserbacteria bacterium]|nr:DUF2341 domain-containing protein [Candidatus Kaiserbacteria bacterium]